MLAKHMQAQHKHAKVKEGTTSIADAVWACERAAACFKERSNAGCTTHSFETASCCSA
jgi:hypothetical protein